MIKILPLGTSRLHRPLVKRENGKIVTNMADGVQIKFPRLGYFHSSSEIAQTLEFLHGRVIPGKWSRFCFRAEPAATTPFNEFDQNLRDSIQGASDYTIAFDLQEIDIFVLEISSLWTHFHPESDLFFISNPNLFRDVPYADVWREGFYSAYAPELGVRRYESLFGQVTNDLMRVKTLAEGRPIVLMGHLVDPSRPNGVRERLNAILMEACADVGIIFFENSSYVREYGFRVLPDGVVDIHHLSPRGEAALGKDLQEFCIRL